MLRLVKRWGAKLSALVAAGTLGVAPAAAQAPACPGGLCARAIARTVATAKKTPARRVGEVPGRLHQIKVELAWLADESTFPCGLTTQCDGSRLMVRGEVPSEKVRQQAVRLARLATSLPVLDGLRVRPGLRPPLPGYPAADQLLRNVMGVLREVLGERARRVEVSMRAGGQVTLRGAVPCYEEKLAISARMRHVSGCTCVVNELTVPPALCEGRVVLPVSADGLKVVTVSTGGGQRALASYRTRRWSTVPARAHQPPLLLGKAEPLTAESETAPRPLPRVPKTPPGALVPKTTICPHPSLGLKPGVESSEPRATVIPVVHVDTMPEPRPEMIVLPAPPVLSVAPPSTVPPRPASSIAKPSPGPPKPIHGFAQNRRAAEKEAREETDIPPEERNPPDLGWPRVVHAEALPPPWKRSVPKPVPAHAPTPLKVPVAEPMLPVGPPTKLPVAEPLLPASAPVIKQAATIKPPEKAVEHPIPAQPVAQTPVVSADKNRGVSHPSLLSLFGKKKESRPVSWAKGPAESTVILSMHTMPMAAKVVGVPTPKAVVSAQPYVTTGLVSFEEEPSEPPAPSRVLKPAVVPATPELIAATPAELQQRVLRVCAGAARDVRVTTRPDRHWEVKIKVPTTEAANEVSVKVLQELPDMAQPHVHLTVEVAP